MPRERRSTSVIACCSLAYGYMRQPPKAGPRVVSWIATSARRPLAVSLREQQRLMAVVVGVTEHISPCGRRAADEGKRHETRSALRTRIELFRHRLAGPPLARRRQHRTGDWTKVEHEAAADCSQCSLCTEDGRYQR